MNVTPERDSNQSDHQKHFELFLKHANEGVWDWVNLKSPEQWWSPRFYELLGYLNREIDPSLNLFERLLHPDDSSETMLAIVTALNEAEHFEREFRLRVKGGLFRWFHCQASILRDETGQAKRMTGSISDVHERVLLEKELEETRYQALRDQQIKHSFLGMISHEIRTPLSSILGFSELLFDANQDSEVLNAADMIHSNGRALLTTLNNFLDLSRLEEGKIDIDIRECSPQRVIENIQAQLTRKAEMRGLDLIVVQDELPASIQSDPIRLKQILLNVVETAMKYTNDGCVKLSIHVRPGLHNEQQLEFIVENTGSGLNTETINHIFAGRQLSDLTSPTYSGGLGLGLSLARKLIEHLGGVSSIQHHHNSGSKIKFHIRTGMSDRFSSKQSSLSERFSRIKSYRSRFEILKKDCRILLVEDGLDNQRLIQFLLNKAKADIKIVANGQLALRELQKTNDARDTINSRFDAILMDIQMPILNGFETTRKIRSLGYSNPIIALTANAMPGDRERCLEAGCDEYLLKPIDRKKLISTINELLGTSQVETECDLTTNRPLSVR